MSGVPGEHNAERGVTRRAVVVALALVVLIAPAAFYGELLYGATYEFASGVPAMAPLVILLLLAAANPLARRFRAAPFTRRELLVIYSIVLVGGPLVAHGILAWMLPNTLTMRYVARAIPEWQTRLLPYLPDWFSPSGRLAVEGYFEGHSAVPWSQWLVPLAAWTSFLIALFVCTLCAVALFSRQWISWERLSFPLAQVPLSIIAEADVGGGHVARLPRERLFWLGVLIPVLIGSANSLTRFFPSIPAIRLSGIVLMQRQIGGPLAGLGELDLWLEPWLIAIAYLIPKELSFSCWFFWFARVALTVGGIAGGSSPQLPEEWWSSSFPAPYYQGAGAMLALGAWALWAGRRHLASSLRGSVRRSRSRRAEDEPLASRWAPLGFALCFAYMVGFCSIAGVRLALGLVTVGLIVAYYVMWARLRAETGLGFIGFPLGVQDLVMVPFGSSVLRPREAVALIGLRWAYSPGFGESLEVVTGNALESLKIADTARVGQRRLLAAAVIGFLLSLAVGLYVVLAGMYHYGFHNTAATASGWLLPQLRGEGGRIFAMLTNPTGSDTNGLLAILAGGAVAILLGIARSRFWWWPFHPYGYLAANLWGMHWYWMPFFAGWMLKSLVTRYGGLRLYWKTVPLATGVIMGDMLSSAIRVALALIWGRQG